jgi:thiol-disulfide isomerase/thioredoxin
MIRRWLILATVLNAAALMWAQEPGKPGTPLPTLTAKDLSGNPVKISTTGKVTAVLFIATQCPVSNDYNTRMEAIYKDYAPRGVQFVFLNANSSEPPAEIEKHAHDNGFSFKVLKDDGSAMADVVGAQFTPETYVVDAKGVIVYHGRIDDSRNEAKVTVKNLRGALDAALAGKAVEPAEVKAFGCTIKRAKKTT